jgi:hypothetical protein
MENFTASTPATVLVSSTIAGTSRFVAYHEDEVNTYDNSISVTMFVDLVDRKLIRHTFRSSIEESFEHEFTTETNSEVFRIIREIAKENILSLVAADSFGKYIGDTVKVSNPRVRNFKGEIFKIEQIWKHRMCGTTLVGRNEQGDWIKTSYDNCSLVEISQERLETAIENEVYGIRHFRL